ncbi:A coat protein [Xanthomonas sacchari]
MKDRSYTGQVCTSSKPANDISQVQADKDDATKPKGQECTALSAGQTACFKPNGDYCATASTGKTFCWQPTETGKKTDGSDAQVKSPKGDPVIPPSVTIPNQEWQRTEGHQNTACVNSTCTTYNVTNYSSVASGTSKNSTGDNTTDGSGNTSGNGAPGKGTSDGDKDGDSDSASDSGNCTSPPACTGDTLKCLHLKFTWKNQCNTAHNEISKGDGCADSDVPVCAGSSCKAEAYAQLLQQWRSRCSAESMRKGVEDQAGQGDGDDGKGSIFITDTDKPGLNEGLISYGGGDLGYNFDVEGIKFQMPQQVLDFIPILRMLIIAAATLYAISIVRGQ